MERNRASELVKRLVEPATSSHGGQYVVRREGLLEGMGADVRARRITPRRKDQKALGAWSIRGQPVP